MRFFTKAVRAAFQALAIACLATNTQTVLAQTNNPQVGYVYPAGGKQGTTVTVIVGGRQLLNVDQVLFSGAGLTARVMRIDRPMTNEERMKFRDELAELRHPTNAPAASPAPVPGAAPTPAPPAKPVIAPKDVPARIAELMRLLTEVPRNQATPALAETVTLEVNIAPDAPIGPHDLRLFGKNGLSLPLTFVVGDLPEAAFPTVTALTPRSAPGSAQAASEAASGGLMVTPPVVVNGQILAGETKRIRFSGHQNQRLIIAVHARALIPYLADAVPGWFQAVVSLFDASGKELAYADDFRFQPDPVMAFQLPADGDYTLVIKDALYRGREDFVYRVTIGELPFVSGLFPLGGTAEKEMDFILNGWNLPTPIKHIKLPQATGLHTLGLGRCAAATGDVQVAVDDLPECVETEPNNTLHQAQPVTLPIIVNGRIAQASDEDWVRFTAKAGTPVVIEVVARRLRSPLDGMLQLFSADGTMLASNDDNDDLADGLTTHHADPRLVFTPTKDGDYFVRLGDAQHRGGADYNYRLRLSPLRPDFALRVVPSSVNLRPSGSAKVIVYALRHDGFTGAITLALKNAPKGFSLIKTAIPAGTDKMEFTLNAPREISGEAGQITALELEGTAVIRETSVSHQAVPADDRMQAFFYRQLVPAQEWLAAVRRGGK